MNKLTLFLITYMILCSAAIAEIKVLNPWVRASKPNAVLFMQIENTSGTADRLTRVNTLEALHTEFHNHVDIGNGTFHMAKVDYIEIPARGYMQLKPGGHHIMLMGIHRPLKEGDTVHVSLGFDSGDTVPIIAPVKAGSGEE